MLELLASLFAAVAMLLQPHPIPAEFREAIASCQTPMLELGTFIGCETTAPDGEGWYAGATWREYDDGHTAVVWVTGP